MEVAQSSTATLLWPQAQRPPVGILVDRTCPPCSRRGSHGTLLPAAPCSSPCLLCKAKSPSPEPALSVGTQILPLVPEVISILMEIPLYGLSPVVLIQCPCSNALHSPAQSGNSAFQCTRGCFCQSCPNRTPPQSVKLRHFWPGVKSPLHSLLFFGFFFHFCIFLHEKW